MKDRLKYTGIPCPECNKKGLSLADHPHAYGHKDLNRVRCRYCKKTFDRQKLNDYLDKVKDLFCTHKKLSNIRGGVAGSGDGSGSAQCEKCGQTFTYHFKFSPPFEDIGSLDNLKKYLKKNEEKYGKTKDCRFCAIGIVLN